MNLKDVLEVCQGTWVNSDELKQGADAFEVHSIASLSKSRAGTVAFFFSREYEAEIPTARPSILVTAPPFVEPMRKLQLPLMKSAAVISCADPYLAMAKLSQRFAGRTPEGKLKGEQSIATGVHPTAIVDPSAKMGARVSIGPYAVIARGVEIGDDTVIGSHSVIEKNCKVGKSVEIFSHVTLYAETIVGDRTRLHSGVVLGADGFGYAPVRENKLVVDHEKIIHTGKVVIGADVEIGSNTTVDRGTFDDTIIEDKVKIDNLVQVGHNCKVGRGTILCGNVGMAGNSSTGEFVIIGGGAGLTNRVHVGDRASVGGMTGIGKDIEAGGTAMGLPARELKEYLRLNAMLSRMLKERMKDRSNE